MAEQKNKSAEQLLSDLHQERLEKALNEFNADKTRVAVGRLLEEYVDDGGQNYFDGAQKDATLYFVDDDYMDRVSGVKPKDEVKTKKNKKNGFFADAFNKLAEKMKTEEPEDYEDEFPEEAEEKHSIEDTDIDLIGGTNKGFGMPKAKGFEPVAPIEEEEAVPPVKPSIFDTAKLSSMDMADIEERLEKVNLKPATMEFENPDDVLKELFGEFDKEEKAAEPKKIEKKESRKVQKKKDSLDDISVEDMGLGSIVNKIAEEEGLKNTEEETISENVESAEKADSVTEDTEKTDLTEAVAEDISEDTQKAEDNSVEEEKTAEPEPAEDTESEAEKAEENAEDLAETITVTSVPEESNNINTEEQEIQEEHIQEDYPTKFKEKNNNKNTYVAEKTVILDKPLINSDEIVSDDNLAEAESTEETQPVSQEDEDMTKEEEVLNAIKTETEAEELIPSRRRRFMEEKKKGRKKPVKAVEDEIEDDEDLEEDEYEDDFEDTEDTEDKPKKGLFGLFKKKKKDDFDDEEDDDFEDEDEDIDEDDNEYGDEDEEYDEEDDDEYDDFDDDYRKGSGVKKFFVGAIIVILIVAVTALAAMCYSYKSQLDSTREQLNKVTGNGTEETTAVVEEITAEVTTATVAEQPVTENATTAVVSSGNNTQAVQIVNSDGTSSNLTGATASGTTYTVKSGDTGEKICKSVYGEYTKENWSKILKANNMNESSTYHPGQELIIP